MKWKIMVLIAVSISGCATQHTAHSADFPLQPGDLLFQDIDAGPLCDAIETVTEGIDGAKFSHVGMVSRVQDGTPIIVEAVGAGVVETPLPDFLERSADEAGNPKVLVGRLQGDARDLIPRSIDIALSYLGRPYDKVFTIDNSAFYCSELLYESFRIASDGKPVFDLAPMTFKDPATSEYFPAWSAYYADLNCAIPEGAPGLNPGGMSRSGNVEIVHAYGIPAGWHGTLDAGHR